MFDDLAARIRAYVDTLPDEQRGPFRWALANRRITCVQRNGLIEVTAWLDDGAHRVTTLEDVA